MKQYLLYLVGLSMALQTGLRSIELLVAAWMVLHWHEVRLLLLLIERICWHHHWHSPVLLMLLKLMVGVRLLRHILGVEVVRVLHWHWMLVVEHELVRVVWYIIAGAVALWVGAEGRLRRMRCLSCHEAALEEGARCLLSR